MRSVSSSSFLVMALVVAFVQPIVVAKYCRFWDQKCVDPVAQTSVLFNFHPLYPDPISLYYAFDASTSSSSSSPSLSSSSSGTSSMTKTGFWLQYQGNRINSSAVDANRTLEIAMRVGNITGSPGGGHNGCDAVWGSDCSSSMIRTLQKSIYNLAASGDNYTYPLQTVLHQMSHDPPSNFSCSPYFFDVQSINSMSFASESTPNTVTMHSSGSGSDPWMTFHTNNLTASRQADQVAVAIISRSPSYDWPPLASPDDIQVQFACVQAPS